MSSKELTSSEESLLSKGLNFCPIPSTVNNFQLDEDLDQFARRLRLKDFFYNRGKKNLEEAGLTDSDTDTNEEVTPIPKFRKKSSWKPPKSKNDNLESFINYVRSDIKSCITNTRNYNLSKSESIALKALKDQEDIVIKPADKGGAVVVMDKTDYIAEGNRQLSNSIFYKQLTTDPTLNTIRRINTILQEMFDKKHIDNDTFDYLRPLENEAKAGRFYMLPKIHKTGNPGRPIVSANSHPTEKISEFVDHHLRPHVKELPSFIQDTTDYLKKMESLNPLPSNTILASMDVSSLYTNIPQDEGIAACEEAWNTRSEKNPPTECLVTLLKLVLENNNFSFNEKHYLQIDGTSMGTKMAPSYANIFMGQLEKRLLASAPYQPLSWFRFIDDIDFKWTDSQEHLNEFLEHCNSFHHSIKFTYESSMEKINFLDTTSYIKNGTIITDLHTKQTDKHQFLSPKSCHPKHCSRGIPFSQALRIKRICSTENTKNARLGQLRKHLVVRGYNNNIIDSAFERANKTSRQELLEYKDKNKAANRTPLVLTYHPDFKNVSSIVQKHWKIIENDLNLKKVFSSPPVMAFRRPKNIRDKLVTSVLAKQPNPSPGCYKQCGRRNCLCCKAANTSSSFISSVTKQNYTIYSNSNCKTENSIYILTCDTCGIQYVGETMDKFNIRLNNHRSSYKTNKNCPLTRHLRSTKHPFDNVTFQIIEVNTEWDTTARRRRENFWIHQLHTLEPDGLNEKDEKRYRKDKE